MFACVVRGMPWGSRKFTPWHKGMVIRCGRRSRFLVVVAVLAVVSFSLSIHVVWNVSSVTAGVLEGVAHTIPPPPQRRPRRTSGRSGDSSASSRSRSTPIANATENNSLFSNESNFFDGFSGSAADQTIALNDVYRTLAEQGQRHVRFPSVEERVQVYMSHWYLPNCHPNRTSDAYVQYSYINSTHMVFQEARTAREKPRFQLRTFVVDTNTDFDSIHFFRSRADFDCDNSKYCVDMKRYLFPALPPDDPLPVPIVFQFSDIAKTRAYSLSRRRTAGNPNIPTWKKFRSVLSEPYTDGECVVAPRPPVQPIIFKLKTRRHYGMLASIPTVDRAWEDKQDRAVFRGQFTGSWPPSAVHRLADMTPTQQCQLLPRCRLVYQSAVALRQRNDSSLVDARLALPVLESRRDFPTRLDGGVDLYAEWMSMEELLSYKAIIMLEGNDVSSGLKWALFSNSVVMMPNPTKTSWAMEELLEPWVHYVPLEEDLGDVEEKMQWVLDHDMEAQAISHRGRLWIADLVFHPDAHKEEEEIIRRMVQRYQHHFHETVGLSSVIGR